MKDLAIKTVFFSRFKLYKRMYINKIDEILDTTIDDFYNKHIMDDKFMKMLKDDNFVKNQLQINNILSKYTSELDNTLIKEIASNQQNIKTILDAITKYLAYYIFMTISIFYKGKRELFINNVLEFSKNQPTYNFKIANFFTSESNSNVIKYHDLIKNVLLLVNATEHQYTQLITNPKYEHAKIFLEEFGTVFVKDNFKLENLEGNVLHQSHNIIKVMIISDIYIRCDKKELYDIILNMEKQDNVYIYIDIVIPKTTYIDYNVIESMLTLKEIESGLANNIYDLLTSSELKFDKYDIDKKIEELINSKILVPIVDDFLLYHKDTEVYEKQSSTDQKKRKSDTRIKYIVNKIDTVSDLYSQTVRENSKLLKEIENHFYLPLSDRRAILINNTEELKMIKKMHNIIDQIIEMNEYYNDLLNYRKYPYISFKDIKNYGFHYISTKTIDAVRLISFENVEKSTEYLPIQTRVSHENQSINIVGFILPTTTTSMNCLLKKDFIDIRQVKFKNNITSQISNTDNGYKGILKFIRAVKMKNKKHQESIKWMFNVNKDIVKMDKYIQIHKNTDESQIKLIISKLYDDIIKGMYETIIKIIQKKKKVTFSDINKIIDSIEKMIMKFPKNSLYYHKIMNYFYEVKCIKKEVTYDKKDDIFYGLTGDIIKLPSVTKDNKDIIPIISYREIKKIILDKISKTQIIETGAICQHFKSWEDMIMLRRNQPNVFSDLLYDFINKYAVVDSQNDYVCKSCGSQIDLKNYVMDGTYSDDGKFVALGTAMEIPLAEIPEYEKYKPTILHLEKLIERIASIVHINYFSGNTSNVKWRKRGVIKDTIDLLLVHNPNLKENYKERNEKMLPLYGLNKDMTNLFIFELDNNIFVSSSKDKDFMKPIKQNNILLYVLFLMILELNESQILYLGSDKICNYTLFEKYGFDTLFSGINIRKNNKGDIVPIQQYKSFCYMLYYASCMITKYNMWYVEENKNVQSDKPKTRTFNPVIQKIIICTMIDIINSIIEFYGKVKKNRIYEIISIKTFNKLGSLYTGNILLEKIKGIENKKIYVDNGKKKMIKGASVIPIAKKYTPSEYNGYIEYSKYKMVKIFYKPRTLVNTTIHYINNTTNCVTGLFHKWFADNGTFKCKLCGVLSKETNYNGKLSEEISGKYKMYLLKNLSKKYCVSGNQHIMIYDPIKKINYCSKCNYNNTTVLSDNDLKKLDVNVSKTVKLQKKKTSKKESVEHKENTEKKTNIEEFYEELCEQYNKYSENGTNYGFLSTFVNNMEILIGKDVNIENQHIYLNYDTYIIDHDNNGNLLDNVLIITEKENKMYHKSNHSFFNKDIIYYTNNEKKIDTYYDAVTMQLLGYKEYGGEYKYSKINNRYIQINKSIHNKLKHMGYPSKYVDIKSIIVNHNIVEPSETRPEPSFIVDTVSRDRIINLKKIISDIQRIIFKVKYKYSDKYIIERDSKYIDIIAKYSTKIERIHTRNKESKGKVFRNWDIVTNNIFYKKNENNVINISADQEHISVEDICILDTNGNIILYYIVQELQKLIDYNKDKSAKIQIINMIIDIINEEYEIFNKDRLVNNHEIKKFYYQVTSQKYKYDEEGKGHGLDGDIEGFYGEHVDPTDVDKKQEKIDKEKMEELMEERDALDIDVEIETPELDTELDYEIDYTSGINIIS